MDVVSREMLAAGPGCALANGMLNGLETTKVKLQLMQQQQQQQQMQRHTTSPSGRLSSLPLHSRSHHCASSLSPRPSSSSTTTTATTVVSAGQHYYRQATTLGVMRQIAAEEGVVRGLLLPGLDASLARSFIYGAYRVGLYAFVRDHVVPSTSSSASYATAATLPQRLVSGMVTGALGALLTCPLDVVRTRLQADAGRLSQCRGYYTTGLRQGMTVRYRHMGCALYSLLSQEPKQLYRGAAATISRAALLNGVQLATYDTLKHGCKQANVVRDEGWVLHVLCAFASGVVAQTAVMPLDTAKSHLMMGQSWRGLWDELLSQKQQHGLRGKLRWMYRGYGPASAGQGLIMVLQMPLIEEFRRQLGVKPI